MIKIEYFVFIVLLGTGCKKPVLLHPVTVSEFSKFISATGYKTDAEKFGWSIIQEDVYSYRVDSSLSWQIPNGVDSAKVDFPVTQVSFNDAVAYCKWANARLPSYIEYWEITKKDKRLINENSDGILPIFKVNLIGNVWELTTTENDSGEIRLAGGSYLCNPITCNGTSQNRKLLIDKTTGNTHIGFAVIYLNRY